MVELVNDLMMKQLNRVTVWEKASIANKQVLPRVICCQRYPCYKT
ncbi:MAG: hypothetical protein HRT50_13730 [Colwellia sp.]|nr:hypothetical protein [Colwellia sp.]